MNADKLLSEGIIALKPSDSLTFALEMMKQQRVSQLPVVNEKEYLGLLSETDITDSGDTGTFVGSLDLSQSRPFIEENRHIYEIIRTFSSLKLTLLPVLDEEKHYLGAIRNTDMFNRMSDIFAIDNPGGIIIFEVDENDYLLTEIAQIVESNDAKILNLYITSLPQIGKIEVTLKINKIDIGPVLQTFNRYDYNIKASYSEDTYQEGLQERFDAFMKYLNV
ncbi:MAG: CBS domain-containing protein [Bacteroidetes bacterium]|nr:CBS domain-containing protein [Bacteroidota bacterium]